MIDEEAEALQEAIEAVFNRMAGGIHTAIPAVVEKYYPETGLIDARPIIKTTTASGGAAPYPVVVSIPLIFQQTKDFAIQFPIEQGDGVLLVFCERSIEGWQESGEEAETVDARTHSLSDAVAIPGLYAGSSSKAPKAKTDGAARVVFGSAEIKLEKTGRVVINGGALEVLP